MKYNVLLFQLLIIIQSFFIESCYREGNDLKLYSDSDSLNQVYQFSTKDIVQNYVDSITSAYCTVFERSVEVPSFMYDDSLDIRDKAYYTNFYSLHSDFISLRLEIIRRTENRRLLEILASQHGTHYRHSIVERSNIPSAKFSNSELARIRLRELDEGIDTLVKITFPRYVVRETNK